MDIDENREDRNAQKKEEKEQEEKVTADATKKEEQEQEARVMATGKRWQEVKVAAGSDQREIEAEKRQAIQNQKSAIRAPLNKAVEVVSSSTSLTQELLPHEMAKERSRRQMLSIHKLCTERIVLL